MAGSLDLFSVDVVSSAGGAPGKGRLEVYVGKVDLGQVSQITELGVDRHELELAPVAGNQAR